MNTNELKKLAEAANLTIYQRASMTSDEFFEAEQLRSRYRSEAPSAILKLLQINAELVEGWRAGWHNSKHYKHRAYFCQKCFLLCVVYACQKRDSQRPLPMVLDKPSIREIIFINMKTK